MMMSDLERQLALSLFREGFKAGADPARARKSRKLGSAADEKHWRAGYNHARAAAEHAETEYRQALVDEAEK